MFRYLDTSDDSFLQKDNDYNRLLKKLHNFTECLSSEEKELLLKMINEVYYKYHKAIINKIRNLKYFKKKPIICQY